MSNNYFGDGNYFIGQVAPNQTENETAENGHGFRVRVRILGVHSLDAEIRNEDLPLAIVKMPTTHGTLNRLSCGLAGGEIVTGYFLDNKRQVPIIDGVLARSVTKDEITAQQAMMQGTTYGKRLKIDSQDRTPSASHTRLSGTSPNGPATPTRKDLGMGTPLVKNDASDEGSSESTSQTDTATAQEATTEDPLALVEFRGDEGPTGESSNQSFGRGLSPDRALQRAEDDIGSLIVIPGGVPVNANPTESQLQQMKNNGFTYYPREQGEGGKFIHTNQNFS